MTAIHACDSFDDPLIKNYLHQVISGQQRGWSATLVRGALAGLSPLYAAAVRFRNRRYDNPHRVFRPTVPVVSVGNLTTGGTGKTPAVEWICRWLQERGCRVVILSRGYRAKGKSPNDEALELEARLPGVPHLQNPDRCRIAEQAIQEKGAQLLVLDDGFQHRRLHRDLNIVLIDATCPFGYGHVLPRGLLREPLVNLARADLIVLTRCDQVARERIDEIRRTISANSDAPQLRSVQSPKHLIDAQGNSFPLTALQGKDVFAFCGIGNPIGFEEGLKRLLSNCEGTLREFSSFDDHHPYSAADMESIIERAQASGANTVLCTHKDLVKVRQTDLGGIPCFAVVIEMEFGEDDEPILTDRLEALLAHGCDDR